MLYRVELTDPVPWSKVILVGDQQDITKPTVASAHSPKVSRVRADLGGQVRPGIWGLTVASQDAVLM